MRIAAIDIGTNSVHMIVVQVRSDGSFEVIDREKDMVRLGAGGLGGRELSDLATASALLTLSKFKRLADSHRVDEIVAAATSAVREAENGGDFLAAVGLQTGIHARVISGTQEARLIHRAACYGVGLAAGSAVTVDIGGGSVEITLGTSAAARLAQSFKLGVIRLTEEFVHTDPMEGGDIRRMVAHIDDAIGPYVDRLRRRGFDRVIGSSGTILSLGALALGQEQGGSADLRNREVPAKQIRRLRKDLVQLSLADRLRLPGLDPRRADLAVVGVVLLDTLLSRLEAKTLTLCDLALREGLVLDYIRSHRDTIERTDRYPDIRRRSVVELAERCNYSSAHAEQIARLALSLFDQTHSAHGLGDRERQWLEFAALLHDIGVHISYARHHRHSYYLVKNGDLRGFSPTEVEIIALLCRYHRRGRPQKGHAGFADLSGGDRRAVRVLAVFLRMAERLDRSHAQVVDELHLLDRGADVLLQIQTSQDAELEMWAAQRDAAPFERLLSKPLRFEIGPTQTAARRAGGASAIRPRRGAAPGRRV